MSSRPVLWEFSWLWSLWVKMNETWVAPWEIILSLLFGRKGSERGGREHVRSVSPCSPLFLQITQICSLLFFKLLTSQGFGVTHWDDIANFSPALDSWKLLWRTDLSCAWPSKDSALLFLTQVGWVFLNIFNEIFEVWAQGKYGLGLNSISVPSSVNLSKLQNFLYLSFLLCKSERMVSSTPGWFWD